MKNKLLVAALVLVLIVVTYFLMEKNKKEKNKIENLEIKEDEKQELESIAPPKSGETPILYDINKGAGKDAIDVQVKNILNNKDAVQDVRSTNKIGVNLFAGVAEKPANMFRKYIYNQIGGKDDTDILVIPTTVNDDFVRSLESVISYVNNFDVNSSSEGDEQAKRKIIEMLNLSDISGYTLYPDYNTLLSEIIDDSKGYGTCKFPKEKKCRKNHWNQWRKDTITICKNMIQASKKMESALKNAAITVLRNNGWKFKGFDQP